MNVILRNRKRALLWAKSNPKKISLARKRRRKANPEKIRRADRMSKEIWRRKNPKKLAAQRRREKLKQYGITSEQYNQLLQGQDNKCAICRTPQKELKKRLSIDHNHNCCKTQAKSCGRCVRGLLCSACNDGLGRFKDSTAVLSNAVTYLSNNS